ncbi:hypothetical protein E4U53_004376 [Claviceps sorghi]|nr:hypothetical protein E4U53_004376 [Claviceps sorghi]
MSRFDRIATVWLNDTEIWRTSTAEPKPHPGISWTFWKDVTRYAALWRRPQTLVFDLGNLVNDKYTGSFNATLTATYFREQAGGTGPLADPADQILPISAGKGASGAGSAWIYPDDEAAASVLLPRNVRRAVVSVAATGQADEEFWWSNVPEAAKDTFNGTTLPGKGSFREVRLYIDGQVAGLSWPFPVVFTGGITPALHRPVVGPQAFDLREHEVDVTPWLGLLCDGRPHVFSIRVVGADDAVVNRYWVLSGKVFVWLVHEPPGHVTVTTGAAPRVSLSKPNYTPRDTSVRDRHVRYDQTIDRRLEIRSSIETGSGRVDAAWTQTFSMQNQGLVLDSGNFQNLTASYRGRDVATQNGTAVFDATYSYPILCSLAQTALDDKRGLTLQGNLTQSMDVTLMGKAVFSNGLEAFLPFLHDKGQLAGARVTTTKSGTGFFWQSNDGKKSRGFGSSTQHYVLTSLGKAAGSESGRVSDAPSAMTEDGASRRLYWRDIRVVNETTTHDARWAYGLDTAAAAPAVHLDPAAVPRIDDQSSTFAAKFWAGRLAGAPSPRRVTGGDAQAPRQRLLGKRTGTSRFW